MKTIDPTMREKLWENVRGDLERGATLFAIHGVTPKKGQPKKEALAEAIKELVKLAYVSGLDRGYDMGFHVFGDGSDDE